MNWNASEWLQMKIMVRGSKQLREDLKVEVSVVPLGQVSCSRTITGQEDSCKKNDSE